MLKLNLGCGVNHKDRKDGWVNCDKFAPADLIVDLEYGSPNRSSIASTTRGWPWDEHSVDEVLFNHSLEHMGETTNGFFHIIKELYRVCRDGAKVTVIVPHPRSDGFAGDPTHVRPLSGTVLGLLSKKNNAEWKEKGWPNTPLAEQLNVDFEITKNEFKLMPYWDQQAKEGMTREDIEGAINTYWNVVDELTIELVVRK